MLNVGRLTLGSSMLVLRVGRLTLGSVAVVDGADELGFGAGLEDDGGEEGDEEYVAPFRKPWGTVTPSRRAQVVGSSPCQM